MKIEIKNLKHSASLSEETHAFTADVWIDGVKAFHASNDGHGGCNLYYRVTGYQGPTEREVNDWLAANTPKIEAFGMELENDLDLVVGDLLEAQLARKQLDRLLKTKVLTIATDNGEPALFTYKAKPTPEALAHFKAAIASGKIQGELVNGDPAVEARALALL